MKPYFFLRNLINISKYMIVIKQMTVIQFTENKVSNLIVKNVNIEMILIKNKLLVFNLNCVSFFIIINNVIKELIKQIVVA